MGSGHSIACQLAPRSEPALSGSERWLAVLLVAFCGTLGACVGAGSETPTRPAARDRQVVTIERLAPRILPRTDFASPAPVRLIVRNAAPGEIDSKTYESMQRGLGWGAAVGVVSIAEGLAIPGTMFSGGALLGGVVVTIGIAVIVNVERAAQERIVRAVRDSDFERKVANRLQARLETATGAPSDDALEVVVLAYGVVEDKPRDSFCVFADLQVTLRTGATEPYRERVVILPKLRSTDAPVPDCRMRETLADNEGAVIRAALDDYANALPAILARRLPGLPWKR